MPKKTRFVAFDWTSTSKHVPLTPQSTTWPAPTKTANSTLQPALRNPCSGVQITTESTKPSYDLQHVEAQELLNSIEAISGLDTDFSLNSVQAMREQDSNELDPLSYPSTSSLASYQFPTIPAFVDIKHPQDNFDKVSLTSNRGSYRQIPIDLLLSPHSRTRTSASVARVSNGRLLPLPFPEPPSLPSPSSQATCMARSASSPALTLRPSHMDKIWPRKPVHVRPVPGKIYFVPDGRYFPNSIIHNQKHQSGFFRHPVMIFDVEDNTVNFYAMTKEPPNAIRELNMAMRLGTSTEDVGPGVLRLAPGSSIMLQETWVNLEQRFFIEWKNLDEWAVHVQVDYDDFDKIARRVVKLEADQNRYIYKPLLRVMSTMLPGMVIMLPNAAGSATFGAPILVVENNYPNFSYLRVKRFEDNINFNPIARRQKGSSRRMSLAITRQPRIGHDGTPVMILEADSPEMREESYVEVNGRLQLGRLDTCKTWCWPPVRIKHMSMVILDKYMTDIAAEYNASHMAPYPQVQLHLNEMAYGNGGPVYPRTAEAYGGYYQPSSGPQPHDFCLVQQPGNCMNPPLLVPAHSPGSYFYGSSIVLQRHPRTRSE